MQDIKQKSDSYLMKMTKAEIIEELRTAEHNFFVTEEAFHNATESAKKICGEYEDEIKELKRMLRLAVEDIEGRSYCSMCKNGVYNYSDTCKRCNAIALDMFEWGHKDEAMKLIGDDKR